MISQGFSAKRCAIAAGSVGSPVGAATSLTPAFTGFFCSPVDPEPALHAANGMLPDLRRGLSEESAKKVMPHLRNLWPEWNNHDDRFWCHPMHEPVPTRIAAE